MNRLDVAGLPRIIPEGATKLRDRTCQDARCHEGAVPDKIDKGVPLHELARLAN